MVDTNVKPYQCRVCFLCFARKELHDRHQRRVHLAEHGRFPAPLIVASLGVPSLEILPADARESPRLIPNAPREPPLPSQPSLPASRGSTILNPPASFPATQMPKLLLPSSNPIHHAYGPCDGSIARKQGCGRDGAYQKPVAPAADAVQGEPSSNPPINKDQTDFLTATQIISSGENLGTNQPPHGRTDAESFRWHENDTELSLPVSPGLIAPLFATYDANKSREGAVTYQPSSTGTGNTSQQSGIESSSEYVTVARRMSSTILSSLKSV